MYEVTENTASSVVISDRHSLKNFFVIRSVAFSLLNFRWPLSTFIRVLAKVCYCSHYMYEAYLEFPEGCGILEKIPSVGEVFIFSGTTQLNYPVIFINVP